MTTFQRIKQWIKKDWNETKVLFRCIPALPFALLCVALVAMNYLANKGIIPEPADNYIQLDAGILVSWIAFLAADMLVKRFGAKAAIKANIAAILLQLVCVLLLTAGTLIPWGSEADAIEGFDEIFALSIWPLAAGTAAFIIATIVDSLISKFLLTRFKNRTSFKAYAVASYTSTAIGQFLDNLLFALFFSIWQSWFTNINAIWLFAAAGMVVELIAQAILSPVGYWIARRWAKNGVGKEYIALVDEAKAVNMTGDAFKDAQFEKSLVEEELAS